MPERCLSARFMARQDAASGHFRARTGRAAASPDPAVYLVNMPYGSQITATISGGGVVHCPGAGEPAAVRGAARLLHREPDLRPGRGAVRLYPVGDDRPGPPA